MAYVDAEGTLRAQKLLPAQALMQKDAVLKQFILDNKPDLIVVNSSGGVNSQMLAHLLSSKIVNEVAVILKDRVRERREERERGKTQ